MKKLIILIFAFLSFSCLGSHVVSAQLTYRCLAKGINVDSFALDFTINGDCAGISLPPYIVIISVQSISCGISTTDTLYAIGTVKELILPCLTQPTSCTTGTGYGVHYLSFTGTINLPHCKDWIFSFSNCCRNAAITTVIGSSSYLIYVAATLDNTIYCVTSPTFNSLPVVVVCLNTENVIASNAINNGDSIVCKLINPLSTSSVKVPYHAAYDSVHFVKGTVNFNTATGEIIVNPTSLEISIYAIQIAEYINGKLVSTVMRDVQIVTINSSCCSAMALPVSLLYFEADKSIGGIKLSWATASETNNDHFTIYRTSDYLPYMPVCRVYSQSSNADYQQYYSIVDKGVKPGTNYYKLRQTDFDGHTTDAAVLVVNYKSTEEVPWWHIWNYLGQKIRDE